MPTTPETFEAARLVEVHPGALLLEAGPSLVALRALERYPAGTVVTWTCSPAAGDAARLAQGVPRVELTLADAAGTEYPPLGASTSGGGRTLLGTSFFGAAPPEGVDAIEVAVAVSGATGASVPIVARGRLALD
jgi:hypothetical protein